MLSVPKTVVTGPVDGLGSGLTVKHVGPFLIQTVPYRWPNHFQFNLLFSYS